MAGCAVSAPVVISPEALLIRETDALPWLRAPNAPGLWLIRESPSTSVSLVVVWLEGGKLAKHPDVSGSVYLHRWLRIDRPGATP